VIATLIFMMSGMLTVYVVRHLLGWWRMKTWSAIFAGMLFGLGLTLSGMSDPLKVLGFLDVSGEWIPALALVMGGALIVSLATTPWVLKHNAPRFASQFYVPTTSHHR
jgi:uncharacterized membrane protein YedE/YeeE